MVFLLLVIIRISNFFFMVSVGDRTSVFLFIIMEINSKLCILLSLGRQRTAKFSEGL